MFLIHLFTKVDKISSTLYKDKRLRTLSRLSRNANMSEKLPDKRGAFVMRPRSDSARRRPIASYNTVLRTHLYRAGEATGSILRRESVVFAGLMVEFVFPYGI
jgi:hypothetical protein